MADEWEEGRLFNKQSWGKGYIAGEGGWGITPTPYPTLNKKSTQDGSSNSVLKENCFN